MRKFIELAFEKIVKPKVIKDINFTIKFITKNKKRNPIKFCVYNLKDKTVTVYLSDILKDFSFVDDKSLKAFLLMILISEYKLVVMLNNDPQEAVQYSFGTPTYCSRIDYNNIFDAINIIIESIEGNIEEEIGKISMDYIYNIKLIDSSLYLISENFISSDKHAILATPDKLIFETEYKMKNCTHYLYSLLIKNNDDFFPIFSILRDTKISSGDECLSVIYNEYYRIRYSWNCQTCLYF